MPLLLLLFFLTIFYFHSLFCLILKKKSQAFLPVITLPKNNNIRNKYFNTDYKNEKIKKKKFTNKYNYRSGALDNENKGSRLDKFNDENKDEYDILREESIYNGFDTLNDNINSDDYEGIINQKQKQKGKHRYNVYDNELKKNLKEIDLEKVDKIDRTKCELPPYIYKGIKVYEGKSMNYEPEVYDFRTYNKYFDDLCKEKKALIDSYQLDKNLLDETYFDAKKGGPKTFGFKFKQIQPVKYHEGRAYTYFFMHSHEVELSPIFLNAFRRVAIKHLKGGRVTALRIPNMKHEFYCIVGVRENFFDIAQNLRQITFKNVPEDVDMDNYLTGKFRIKGPMIVVAGHMQLPGNVEIINKNQYICSVSAGSYLEMDVKIESIEEYVMPEYGSQSRNRDICKDNFIHFSSSCTPVEFFGFTGQRRGINLDILGEINIVEMHTDGSIAPKTALLKTIDYLSENFQYIENALYHNCHTCDDGTIDEEFRNPEFYMDKDRYTDVPWNKYKSTTEELEETKKWLYRKDVHRQYNIDPESVESKQEREILWDKKQKFIKEIEKRKEQIKKGPSVSEGEIIPNEERHDCLIDWPVDKSERNMNPPRWVIERPLEKNPHVGHEEIYDEGI
ncbi:DNA-directed RNA polymerase alpha chain, putative [Plasmodium gallinaceum]|uniref:DNA-directed RNA polymerase alpha chain, putative n=1 Tax=Plasmodium gallinaceum TaxID=5849 RepID=A0A1J1GYA0_PLAGA|nr:DNA-directed RNA polymerase alpha chain, putative [Plasmodium gallinaceum]CRG97464.1 DNA-directed RNA polymerase alpha chain, putative [Plasmodium gallinaceum]